MFEWKLEDMILLNDKNSKTIGDKKIFTCESEVSREDKITFVNSMQNGKLSDILFLIDKFEEDKKSMPKDKYGDVKTVSLKAWVKRNDNKYVFSYYDCRKFCLLGCTRQITYNPLTNKGMYDTYNDLVDELFHRQLKECKEMERKYFLDHDEYSILKKEFRDCYRRYDITFGVPVSLCSDGCIYIIKDTENYQEKGNKREITIDELKYLISKYKEVDKFIEKITEETESLF